MKWNKLGIVFDPRGRSRWMHSHALQPTPLQLDATRIRVYAGFRDRQGLSRVGYVDVDSKNPAKVLGYSKEPVLDIGAPGCFDDNGVVPAAIVTIDGGLRLYYAGYQIHHHVRFTVFGGLATSKDGGNSFERFTRVPVMDRTNDELLFRVPHSVLRDKGVWRIWYGGGSRFEDNGTKTLPVYDVRYVDSTDGIHIPSSKGRTVLAADDEEYRLGRPYVTRRNGGYSMYFGASTRNHPYILGYAESEDGMSWTRCDEKLNLTLPDSGFDSEMMAYPAVVECKERIYLFYNGNEYGAAGFAVAVKA